LLGPKERHVSDADSTERVIFIQVKVLDQSQGEDRVKNDRGLILQASRAVKKSCQRAKIDKHQRGGDDIDSRVTTKDEQQAGHEAEWE
jgi:type II secretory pathway component GspD/PulD (secretin)